MCGTTEMTALTTEIRFKADHELYRRIHTLATARGVDMQDIERELLTKAVAVEWNAHMLFARLVRSEGIATEPRGNP